MSCPTWYITALFVRSIPVFQDVSNTIIETFKLISHARSVWVAAEWLCYLHHRNRWWRQILSYGRLATNWCPQNFFHASSAGTQICQKTKETCIHMTQCLAYLYNNFYKNQMNVAYTQEWLILQIFCINYSICTMNKDLSCVKWDSRRGKPLNRTVLIHHQKFTMILLPTKDIICPLHRAPLVLSMSYDNVGITVCSHWY